MFGNLGFSNYSSRKVARDKFENGDYLSTASVHDSEKPFETCLFASFLKCSSAVLEDYDTHEEAVAGHARWKARYLSGHISPDTKDGGTSDSTCLARRADDAMGDDPSYERMTTDSKETGRRLEVKKLQQQFDLEEPCD